MSKELDDLKKEFQKLEDFDARKQAVQEKDLILREHRVGRELDELIKNTAELEQAKSINFGRMSPEYIQQLITNNNEYMIAARNSMSFINKEFKNVVPFFRKNLILIGGDTGDGKSTTVANIIFRSIKQTNPETGRSCRVLVLTNEEDPSDFYNRVTCLLKGWRYTNHDQFSEEQRKTFNQFISLWASDGRLTIIGDVHEGIPGTTTTVEGIESVFNNLIREKDFYDVVIIDYYQNIRFSKIDPKLGEYDCQRKLSAILDQMKLKYPGPIVLMAQMKRLEGEEDTTPFNVRMKGSKIICDKATFICELIPQREKLCSVWKVWKSRFNEYVGRSVWTGFDRGMFVPYSIDFQKNVSSIVNKNLERKKAEEAGISPEGEENGPSDTAETE